MLTPSSTPKKILVVEDDATNRKLLRVMLEAEGFTIVEAADGAAALALLGQQEIDVILSDAVMRPMDGFRLCSEVKKNKEFCRVPFIIYSCTYASPRYEKEAVQVGVDKFIWKPVPTKCLVEAICETFTESQLKDPDNPA